MRPGPLVIVFALALPLPSVVQTANNVSIPRTEVSLAEPIYRATTSRSEESYWTYGRIDVSVARNLSDHLALDFRTLQTIGGLYVMAGARAATRFFYGSSRDPVPGRFFVEAAIGAAAIPPDMHASVSVLAGAGADLMLIPAHGVSLRQEISCRAPNGHTPESSSCVLSVGLLVGPRVKR